MLHAVLEVVDGVLEGHEDGVLHLCPLLLDVIHCHRHHHHKDEGSGYYQGKQYHLPVGSPSHCSPPSWHILATSAIFRLRSLSRVVLSSRT